MSLTKLVIDDNFTWAWDSDYPHPDGTLTQPSRSVPRSV